VPVVKDFSYQPADYEPLRAYVVEQAVKFWGWLRWHIWGKAYVRRSIARLEVATRLAYAKQDEARRRRGERP
jgi:hypothetical protein